VTTLSGNPALEQQMAGLLASSNGSRVRLVTFAQSNLAQRLGARRAAGARYRAADAVRRLPGTGRGSRRLRRVLGQTVVHRAALLPAARHSLCLRSWPRPALDGGDRRSAGLSTRPRRGTL